MHPSSGIVTVVFGQLSVSENVMIICFDDAINDSLTDSRVNWALVRKCLRVPFLMSLGGTGVPLG